MHRHGDMAFFLRSGGGADYRSLERKNKVFALFSALDVFARARGLDFGSDSFITAWLCCLRMDVPMFPRQEKPRRHTFNGLRASALAIRGALSPLLLRGGSPAAPARNVGVLAQGGAFALYAAWLAVLWEGCTVVPLSAEAPVERIGSILEDASVAVVLVTDEGGAEAAGAIFNNPIVPCRDVRVVDVRPLATTPASNGDEGGRSAAVSETAEAEEADDWDSASGERDCYIYYTSGSSGEPKGVSSGHGPMINRLRWMWQRWPFAEDEVCCQRVDHVFIDFVAEVFGPLSRGVPITVVPCAVRKNPVLLRDFISDYGVTRITLVPTLAKLVVEAATTAGKALHGNNSTLGALQVGRPGPRTTATAIALFQSVRLWILSGEALPWSVASGLARLSQPTSTLLNLYGSTEVAADITFCSWKCDAILSGADGSHHRGGNAKADRGNTSSVPIGRPISGCRAELMEEAEVPEQRGENGTRDYRLPAILRAIDPSDHGRIGMLYVCGAGLARGYWRRQGATEKSFPSYVWDSESSCYRLCANGSKARAPGDHGVQNGVVGGSGEGEKECRDGRPVRFFRTGDLASFEKDRSGDDDWVLVYRGRKDQQVKISGKRLDLGEVEACLFRADGVKLAAAVALSGRDAVDGAGGDGDEGSDLVFAVVSPETADTAVVRERLVRIFSVPLVVVAVRIVPTLPSSGKVDRGEVRRMALEHLRHRRGNTAVSARETFSRLGDSGCRNWSAEEATPLIRKALACALQTDRDAPPAQQVEVTASSDFFAEVGLSSVQAVTLVHELRRALSTSGGGGRDHGAPRTVRLIDLYLHPSCRSLAEWLVPIVGRTAGDVDQDDRGLSRDTALQATSSQESSVAPEALDGRSSGSVEFSVRPITRDLRSETVALFCNVFLDSEPLLSASFKRCRASVGPAGAKVMRLCYNRLVSRSIDSLLRRGGGRVLVATENATGRVLGFTIGTELVESAEGSGFLASRGAAGGDVDETLGPTRGDAVGAHRRTEATSWQKGTGWLLRLPIGPMMRPVSSLMDELLGIYQYDRGWPYAPGEVMYISETGCHLDQEATGAGGGSGVQAALMAESLERQLVREASAAGFVRAVTICTNAVTAHVAREMGFKEIERVAVQTYRPASGREKSRLWRGRLRAPRQDGASPSAAEHPTNLGPGSAPFARVSAEHAHAVLFEKVLAPGVPVELLLHRSRREAGDRTASSGASNDSGVAFAAGELWRFVRVGQGSPVHERQMLAILANSLPALSFSGRATRYMTDDVGQGREAFLLLSARAMATGTGASEGFTRQPAEPDEALADDLVPSPSGWTVAACMSWRRHTANDSDDDDRLGATKPEREQGLQAAAGEGRVANEGTVVRPSAGRELLVLAVGRRWRYRGLGAALVARLLRDSARHGASHVLVRSLPESVGFYERQGFRAESVHTGDTGGGHGAAAVPTPDGECLLIHDLAHGTFCSGS